MDCLEKNFCNILFVVSGEPVVLYGKHIDIADRVQFIFFQLVLYGLADGIYLFIEGTVKGHFAIETFRQDGKDYLFLPYLFRFRTDQAAFRVLSLLSLSGGFKMVIVNGTRQEKEKTQ